MYTACNPKRLLVALTGQIKNNEQTGQIKIHVLYTTPFAGMVE